MAKSKGRMHHANPRRVTCLAVPGGRPVTGHSECSHHDHYAQKGVKGLISRSRKSRFTCISQGCMDRKRNTVFACAECAGRNDEFSGTGLRGDSSPSAAEGSELLGKLGAGRLMAKTSDRSLEARDLHGSAPAVLTAKEAGCTGEGVTPLLVAPSSLSPSSRLVLKEEPAYLGKSQEEL